MLAPKERSSSTSRTVNWIDFCRNWWFYILRHFYISTNNVVGILTCSESVAFEFSPCFPTIVALKGIFENCFEFTSRSCKTMPIKDLQLGSHVAKKAVLVHCLKLVLSKDEFFKINYRCFFINHFKSNYCIVVW